MRTKRPPPFTMVVVRSRDLDSGRPVLQARLYCEGFPQEFDFTEMFATGKADITKFKRRAYAAFTRALLGDSP